MDGVLFTSWGRDSPVPCGGILLFVRLDPVAVLASVQTALGAYVGGKPHLYGGAHGHSIAGGDNLAEDPASLCRSGGVEVEPHLLQGGH